VAGYEINLQPRLTQAGMNASVVADGTGVVLRLASVSLGNVPFTPTGLETEIPGLQSTVPIAEGQKHDTGLAFTIRAVDDSAKNYQVRSLGFHLEDGTLLAVWSDPDIMLGQKTPNVQLHLVLDLHIVEEIPPGTIDLATAGDLNLVLDAELVQFGTAIISLFQLVNALWLREFDQDARISLIQRGNDETWQYLRYGPAECTEIFRDANGVVAEIRETVLGAYRTTLFEYSGGKLAKTVLHIPLLGFAWQEDYLYQNGDQIYKILAKEVVQ